MAHIKTVNEMNGSIDGNKSQNEYPVYYVVKRFCYDGKNRNGYWREETICDTVAECEKYIERNSYKHNGETGKFAIYMQQLIKFVGEE